MPADLRKTPMPVSAPLDEADKSTTDHVDQNTKNQMSTVSAFPVTRLYATVGVLSLVLIVIELLARWSIKHKGLGPSLSSYSYLWRYGPIFIFATVSTLWNQAADRVKEAVTSHRTKNSHGLPALVTLGRILVAMPIGLSFHLLESQCVKRERAPVNLLAHARFSGADYSSEDVDANPVLTVAGVHGLGQPWPPGTTDTYAFQPFSTAVQSREVGGIVAGVVDLFTPDLQCQAASVNSAPECSSLDCVKKQYTVGLSTSSCSEYRISLPGRAYDGEDEYYADVVSASCKDAAYKGSDPQLIFVVAHWKDNIPRVSSVACTPHYSISQAHVSLHQGNGSAYMIIPFRANDQVSESHIPGVAPTDLAAGFMSTLREAETPLSIFLQDGDLSESSSSNERVQYSAFHRIANLSFPRSPEDLLDTSVLERVSRQTYTSICAQIARKYLLHQDYRKFEGDAFGNVNRVMVSEPLARLLETILVALILLSVTVLVRRPETTPSSH